MLVQTLGSFAVTAVATGFTRAALFLVFVPLASALLCATGGFRPRSGIVLIVAATATTLAIVLWLRRGFDPTAFFGPAPPNLEYVACGAMLAITTLCAACVLIPFSSRGLLHRFRWGIAGAMGALLIAVAVVTRLSLREPTPSDLLQRIVVLEQRPPTDPLAAQELGTFLAMCGREAEANAVTRQSVGHSGTRTPSKARPYDISQITPLPWRETLSGIVEQERLILLMEAHHAPRHRQWIEQSLAVLRTAGFRDYAAEGLAESGESLRQRGYPTSASGFYVLDPHFGNVLRTAIDLDFRIHAYESYGSNPEQRESGQAENLARLFSADPDLKLVVHAGYGHIFKTPDDTGFRTMAVHLWEMTGIEPFCIWQTYHSSQDGEARQLATLAEAAGEPVMLAPVPSGLTDSQFRFPSGAVDALVVHSASIGGPAKREHSFPSARQRIAGRWNGAVWPVIIGAFPQGEPADAIALDQVMLRQGEHEFALWVPGRDSEIRAFTLTGRAGPLDVERRPNWTLKSSRTQSNAE